MQVSEVLRVKGSTLFTVNPETMLSDCVITMADHDVGSLVVMDRGRLAGMLTFREIVRVLARRQLEHRAGPTPPVAEIVVRDVMNADPFVVSPEMDVNELRLEGWARSSLLTVYVEKNLKAYPATGHLKIPLKAPVLLSSVTISNQHSDGTGWSLNNSDWLDLPAGKQILPVDNADTLFLRFSNSTPDTSIRLVAGESVFTPVIRSGLISSVVPEPEVIVGAPFSYGAVLFSTGADPLSPVSIRFKISKTTGDLYTVDSTIFRSQSRMSVQFSVPARTLTDTGDYLLSMTLTGAGILDEFSTVTDSMSVVVATGVDDFNPDIRLYHRATELLTSERSLVPKTSEYEVVIGYTDYLLLDDTTRIGIYLNGAPVPAGNSLTLKQSEDRTESILKFTAGLVEGINRFEVSVQPPFGPYSVEPKTESWQVVVDGSPGIRDMANYPNPFADETQIYLELGGFEDPESGEIHIFTINGLKIRTIRIGKPVVGHNAIHWDGRDQDGDRVANGVYLYRAAIRYGEKTVYQTGKMLKAE